MIQGWFQVLLLEQYTPTKQKSFPRVVTLIIFIVFVEIKELGNYSHLGGQHCLLFRPHARVSGLSE